MNSRRSFLKTSLAGSAVIGLSAAVPEFLLGATGSSSGKNDGNILVVVQLSGGNDGLNTIIPFGDDEYYKNRFTLAVNRNDVLKIDDRIGFHPAMRGLSEMLQAGDLGIVQGVGYPDPVRSHFESMDLWHTAHQVTPTSPGWLGRAVDAGQLSGDLPAIHFGGGLQPLALRNETIPSPTIQSIDNFRFRLPDRGGDRAALQRLIQAPRAGGNELLGYVCDNANVALATSERLENVVDKNETNDSYPVSRLGQNLKAVARLIGSGLSTQIYYTTLDGFDTHTNQLAGHRGLLTDFSDSVAAFWKEVREQGNGERVTLLAFSEFGRRVRENASAGTDHGAAGPVFVAGGRVKPGLLSDHPDLSDLDEGDLKFGVDYRTVYSSLLRNWLGVNPKPILGADFDPFPLFA